jgi:hypothetical protein
MAILLAKAIIASNAADPLAKTASAGNAASLWAEAVIATSDGDKRAISVTTGVAHG